MVKTEPNAVEEHEVDGEEMIKLKNNAGDHYVKVDGRERIQNFQICIGKCIKLLMIPITTNMIIFCLGATLPAPSMLKLQKIMLAP